MYDYLDRAVGGLGHADGFLLGAMRTWVAAARSGRCGCAALQDAFERHASTAARRDFAIAMATLDREGQGRLRFRPLGAPRVGDDEARVLALFALGRAGAAVDLRRAAAGLVVEEGAPRLARAASLIGAAFGGAVA